VVEPTAYLELDQWIQLEETGSTNDYLMSSSYPPGTIVTTKQQTAGKGRSGRLWRSEQSALYFSGSFGWSKPPGPLFSLAMGLGVLHALEAWPALAGHRQGLWLKWPNDLVRKETGSLKKLGGILIEGKASSSGWQTVVGIGINWFSAPYAAGEDPLPPGALLESRREEMDQGGTGEEASIGPLEFVPVLIKHLNRMAVYFQNPAFPGEYRSREIMQNREVSLRDQGIRAVVTGINDQGSLILDNGTVIEDSARNLELL